MREAEQLWHISKSKSTLKKVPLENPNTKTLGLARSLYSNISLGTEKMVASGDIPKSLWDTMKVPYQLGGFELPISYGYSLVVELEKQIYHLMHPHHSLCLVNKNNLTLIPEDLDPKTATQISNMETVINAIWESNPQPSDTILICGFGSIGSLLAITLWKEYNLKVYIKEVNSCKIEIAESLGFQTSNHPDNFSICFNTTANNEAMQYCIDRSQEEGKIFELSWYGNKKAILDLGGVFHTNRLQIKAVQVSNIPFHKRKSENFKTRKSRAIAILLNHQSTYDKLISNIVSIEKSPDFFNHLRTTNHTDEILNLIQY